MSDLDLLAGWKPKRRPAPLASKILEFRDAILAARAQDMPWPEIAARLKAKRGITISPDYLNAIITTGESTSRKTSKPKGRVKSKAKEQDKTQRAKGARAHAKDAAPVQARVITPPALIERTPEPENGSSPQPPPSEWLRAEDMKNL